MSVVDKKWHILDRQLEAQADLFLYGRNMYFILPEDKLWVYVDGLTEIQLGHNKDVYLKKLHYATYTYLN